MRLRALVGESGPCVEVDDGAGDEDLARLRCGGGKLQLLTVATLCSVGVALDDDRVRFHAIA
jgi:hypothetical protein